MSVMSVTSLIQAPWDRAASVMSVTSLIQAPWDRAVSVMSVTQKKNRRASESVRHTIFLCVRTQKKNRRASESVRHTIFLCVRRIAAGANVSRFH